ncbi:MAG: S41 family peptidase [Bacteroidota bacterium]
MKNTILTLLGLVICLLVSAQQNAKVEAMASLGEIWGFLKYYHPQIADGSKNWDSVLMADLPLVAADPSPQQWQQTVQKWLSDAGPVAECRKCTKIKGDTSLRNLDLAFLEEAPLLTQDLKTQLAFIKDNRFQGKSYYAVPSRWNGPVSFENETPYFDELYPSKEMRALALFRYWNAIQYYFPYRYLLKEDWHAVLRRYVLEIYEAPDQLTYHLLMRKLTAEIYDSHSFFASTTWNYSQGKYRLLARPAFVEGKFIIKSVIPDSSGQVYPLEPGDVILTVDGVGVDTLRERLTPYLVSSNEITSMRKVSNWLLVGENESMSIEIERDGKRHSYELKAVGVKAYHEIAALSAPGDSVPKWEKRKDNIGYVDMGRLVREEVDEMMADLMDCPAIIFDVRNYPRSTYRKITDYLNPDRRPFATFLYPDSKYPGRFIWYESPYQVGKRKNKDYYQGKVIVLQNETTQSHAEFTIMAFETAPNCTIIGSQTAAADGNVTIIKLPGGITAYFTGLGVYYPDRAETQQVGIQADIEVKPTIEGIRQGKDEVLEAAIKWAKEAKI